MKKIIIATAAVASLGFAGAAYANQQSYSNTTWQETTTGTYQTAPRTNYAPGYDTRSGMVEGRNSAFVDPNRGMGGSYVDSRYGDGLTTYQRNPGVEPYIAKQIEMDQRGGGN